jgi:outer membrane protein assembly factor BamB
MTTNTEIRLPWWQPLVLASFALIAGTVARQAAGTDDWPQFRGPNRDDISAETNLLEEWPEGGPAQLWRSENAGLGFSGFSVVGDRLYTMGADNQAEFVLCLDATNGEEIWRRRIDERFQNGWGDGPRSTPTVSGDQVFALSARGTVACLNAGDGSVVWTAGMTEMGGEVPEWGYSESVLVDGDLVLCTPGGSNGAIAALDKTTGEVRWQSRLFTMPAHYSSIVVADHPERRHYVQLCGQAFAGIDPADGTVIWQQDWGGRTAVIPTPIYHENHVYITSGYGAGSRLVDISDLEHPRQVWHSDVMKNHHGGVVLVEGHFYGHSDRVGWVCQNFETGDAVWREEEALGKGAISYADGHFYLVAEDTGEVVLIAASPEGWNEKGRFQLQPQSTQRKPDGKIWVHPVISGGRLFLRDQEIIYCFDIGSP